MAEKILIAAALLAALFYLACRIHRRLTGSRGCSSGCPGACCGREEDRRR